MAAVIAWMVYRTELTGRELLDWLAFAPRAVPAVLFAVSMLWLYLTLPLPIYGTLLIILLAYITRYLPIAMRIVEVVPGSALPLNSGSPLAPFATDVTVCASSSRLMKVSGMPWVITTTLVS